MTVGELITLLSKEDPNCLVLIPGYEGGWDSIESIHKQPVNTYETGWPFGRYTESCKSDMDSFPAILLGKERWG